MTVRVMVGDGEPIAQALCRLRRSVSREGIPTRLRRVRHFFRGTDRRRAKEWRRLHEARRATIFGSFPWRTLGPSDREALDVWVRVWQTVSRRWIHSDAEPDPAPESVVEVSSSLSGFLESGFGDRVVAEVAEAEFIIGLRLRLALFELETALGVTLDEAECERVFLESEEDQVSEKRYTFLPPADSSSPDRSMNTSRSRSGCG
jgi:ribosomal protein S21